MRSATILTVLRCLVFVIGLGVVGLGVWSKLIIHDIDIRSTTVLDLVLFDPEEQAEVWQSFFDLAIGSQLKVWISIAAASFSSLCTILIILSSNITRMHMPTFLLLPLEFIAMLSMGAAFGATSSFALKLPPTLNPRGSPDLASFKILLPISRSYAIASGTALFFLGVTAMSFLVQTIHHIRDSKACSFEPTASSLGMTYGYQAAPPQTSSQGSLPTIYDPRAPSPNTGFYGKTVDEEMGLVAAGADMGRRDSTESGAGISGPMGLEKPQQTAQVRPTRPWSEMPKR